MKTIRQIADEIGVSKQTVYKRFKGKLQHVCAPYAHTINGVLYVEEKGEKLIKQDFLEDGSSKLEQLERSNLVHTEHLERSNGAVPEQGHQADLMAVLQATIDTCSFFPARPEPIRWARSRNRVKSGAGLVGSFGTEQLDKSEFTGGYWNGSNFINRVSADVCR